MSIIDYIIVAIYLGGLVYVGLHFKKKASGSIDSYFLGGRTTPWWVLGASGMASNFDITGTMLNTALIFAIGASGFFIEIRGGVTLIMAFLLAFMGKWNRRARVMTIAEWMKFRFGEGRDGQLARIIGAAAQIIFTIAMVTYFSVGAGTFIAEFFGIPGVLGLSPRFIGALCIIVIAMIYTVASGFQGVVWVDLFQSFLVFFTLITISVIAFTKFPLPDVFNVSYPLRDGGFQIMEVTKEGWASIIPKWELAFPANSDYSIFNLFGVAIIFYLIKVCFEGAGGTGGYMIQRFFAAKNDREAGLVGAFWTFLLSFRWLFIMAIAMIGIAWFNSPEYGGATIDPERVLPVVIMQIIPWGLKGILIAGLTAAAMSTFDSTVNAGAAYWVKDIFQTYIKPDASEKEMVWHGRIASIMIVTLGLLFSLVIRNINEIWGWITMALGSGLLIPFLTRWYWWRLNGYGFSLAVFAGIIAAILQKIFFPNIPEYISFVAVNSITVVAMIFFTLITKPTDDAVLANFYDVTRPFGVWGQFKKRHSKEIQAELTREHRNDLLAVAIAIPLQLSLFLTWMALLTRTWGQMVICLSLTLILGVVMYFVWYKNLSVHVD